MTETVILALDTAVTGCSLALFYPERDQILVKSSPTERGQAEILVPMLQSLLADSGHAADKISRIAVTTGPGSFTGLRVGLSVARHLGLALDRPVLGLSTLELYARAAFDHEASPRSVLVAIDTRRRDFYTAIFHYSTKVGVQLSGAAQILDEAALHAVLQDHPEIYLSGDVQTTEIASNRNLCASCPSVVHLVRWAACAADNQAHYNPAFMPQPYYIRDAEISQSKRQYHTLAAS